MLAFILGGAVVYKTLPPAKPPVVVVAQQPATSAAEADDLQVPRLGRRDSPSHARRDPSSTRARRAVQVSHYEAVAHERGIGRCQTEMKRRDPRLRRGTGTPRGDAGNRGGRRLSGGSLPSGFRCR